MNFHTSDYLVVGSGLAGLFASLHLAEYGTVNIVTKQDILASNSALSQGGLAVCINPNDSPAKHLEDTLEAGCHYNNLENARIMVEQSSAVFNDLVDWGVEFDRDESTGDYHLTKEGNHSVNRIVHIGGDQTGKLLLEKIAKIVQSHPKISIFENNFATDIVISNNKCLGIESLHKGEVNRFQAKYTVLATGGYAGVYPDTTNHLTLNGDGVAMAWRIDANISDIEFVQFHPTVLAHPDANGFLISEAVRGEGGYLVNHKGERFMENVHPLKELAPRDIVSRAIWNELEINNIDHVYLDVTHQGKDYFAERFPNITKECQNLGIEPSKDLIPVKPAAHYSIGGVCTNSFGQTNIAHLFAIGEVAATGVHGANRLASNSLLECLVFSKRAAQYIANHSEVDFPQATKMVDYSTREVSLLNLGAIKQYLFKITSDCLGIKRNIEQLRKAVKQLQKMTDELENNPERTEEYYTVRNQAIIAQLIAKTAYARQDSLGCHFLTKE